MTPEEMVKSLEKALDRNLISAVLFGSAAAGDHLGAGSDFNLLVITERLSLADLKAVMPSSNKWIAKGNPPPLFFTRERWESSCDVFPIEILDIMDARNVLYGPDLVGTLTVSKVNLRLQLEHELKGKLIQVREGFLATRGKVSRIRTLLIDSLSSFLVLARASLRLVGETVPRHKLEAMKILGQRFNFDVEPFETVVRIKEGTLKARRVDVDALFDRYLQAAEKFVDAVDHYILPEGENRLGEPSSELRPNHE